VPHSARLAEGGLASLGPVLVLVRGLLAGVTDISDSQYERDPGKVFFVSYSLNSTIK
jgi:hypothetical protein